MLHGRGYGMNSSNQTTRIQASTHAYTYHAGSSAAGTWSKTAGSGACGPVYMSTAGKVRFRKKR
jgi:hypothetical protein